MKTTLQYISYFLGTVFTLLFITTSTAQVGINTITPGAGSLLDVSSTNKGMLVPRVDIANLSTILPITDGSTESLLVYNTNNTTGKGYYYWDGTKWVNMSSDNDDWNILGNTGTDQSTNFIGTTDSEGLTVRTNNIQRFRFNTNNQLLAIANGSAAAPSYSWNGDTTMGFYKSGTSQMDMVINGVSFYNANANIAPSENEWSFNPGGGDINLRVETDNNANTLFVDGSNDNVGFGTNSPDLSAQLEMSAINKGLLINQVILSATNNASPIISPASGLLVYNTTTASSGATEVFPGFYYWDGSKWVAMGGTNGKDWSLEGNAGTNSATNFLGTTDNVHLILRTNDTERMRLLNDGRVAINNNNPFSGDRFTVTGSSDDWTINGYSSGTGVGVYGDNNGTGYGVYGNGVNIGTLGTTTDGNAIHGQASGSGLGVFGYSANNHGVYGTTAYTGGAFLTGGAVGWGTGANGANGVLAITDKSASTKSNIGIRAVSGSTTSISSSEILNIAINANATDLALYALSEGPITSVGDIEAARFQTNYTGDAVTADGRDPRAELAGFTSNSLEGSSDMYYGGFFYSGGVSSGASYSYAGARYGGTNYKIIGNGNVSTIVEGINRNDSKKIMFAPEAPEVLFEDYGIGQLTNGIAHIVIDPIFANNITVNREHPLKVFIQLEGDCNGVFVMNKTGTGFTVKELQNGTSSVSFSWHIVANRKNEIGRNSGEETIYADLRFPDAPSAILPKENSKIVIKEDTAKEKNILSKIK